MTLPVLAFCDLDDTLIVSARKSADEPGRKAVIVSSKGEAIAFQTPALAGLYDWLLQTTRLIPTTGRSSKSFKRIGLPFSDYAICSFGGVILTPSREAEPRWQALIEAQSHLAQDTLQQVLLVCKAAARHLDIDLRVKVVCEHGVELYVSLKHRQRCPEEMVRLRAELLAQLPQGWWIHHNGKNIAVCPPYLGKEIAVRWFLKELAGPHCLVLGFGDSFSDLPFMGLGDFAALPAKSKSQIFTALHL